MCTGDARDAQPRSASEAVLVVLTAAHTSISVLPCYHQAAVLAERRQVEEDLLLAALTGDMGFHHGRPVAAVVTFRWARRLKAFNATCTVSMHIWSSPYSGAP